ncbi:MAG TPA: DUF2326 domain-containing protein [Solirubrobacteraceae bacterium]
MDVLHFCLGGSSPRTGGLSSPALTGWAFTVDLDVGENRVQITRSLASPQTLAVSGAFATWSMQPSWDKESSSFRLSNDQWKLILGQELFDLRAEDVNARFGPSFRLVFPYFARTKAGAYETPFKYFSGQREWQKQVAITFLLDLSWSYAARFQEHKDERDALKVIKRALEQGALGDPELTLGRLRTQRVRLNEQITRLEGQLSHFEVHPEYRAISVEADQLTTELHAIVNARVTRARTISMYEEQADVESGPDVEAVVTLFAQAGVELSADVKRTLEDAQEFHSAVVNNRRSYLHDEIETLRHEDAEAEADITRLSSKRAGLMEILESKHALEEFNRLNDRLAALRAELAETESQMARITEVEERQAALEMSGQALARDSRRELAEREPEWSEAITLFASNTQELYDTPGELVIDLTDNGFSFDVNINRSGSHGINNMKIFAFDLALAQRWSEKDRTPGILWHDSELFDGVDERQVGAALQLANHEANARGFQYFCSLNSDDMPPQQYLGELEIEPVLTLTDASESGGLFGIRF